jgi:glutathione synthase
MNIAVVMDPLDRVRYNHDTTVALMKEAASRGHELFHALSSGVVLGNGVALRCNKVRAPGGRLREPIELDGQAVLPCAAFDSVWVRKDPPFDAEYLATTYLLDHAPEGVFVMNSPRGIRDANEKLSACYFADCCPHTLVSQSPAELDAFRRSVGGAVVIKPLFECGGNGVFLVADQDPNRMSLLRAATNGGLTRVVAQELVDGYREGDKRILLLDGEPLGAVLRVNRQGGFAHNLNAGGEALKAELGPADLAVCRKVAPWLRQRGLWFVGIDVIQGRLIEINVTSPTCLQEMDRLNGTRLASPVLDFVEARAGLLRQSVGRGDRDEHAAQP